MRPYALTRLVIFAVVSALLSDILFSFYEHRKEKQIREYETQYWRGVAQVEAINWVWKFRHKIRAQFPGKVSVMITRSGKIYIQNKKTNELEEIPFK